MIWGVRRALYEIVPKQNGLFRRMGCDVRHRRLLDGLVLLGKLCAVVSDLHAQKEIGGRYSLVACPGGHGRVNPPIG